MKQVFYSMCCAITIGFSLLSCERDDICPQDTPTTPKLIITFFDVLDPEQKKSVTNFRVAGEGMDPVTNPLALASSDSIAIPLRIFENNSSFNFIRGYVEVDNMQTEGNSDNVTFNYTKEEVFLNRACGFIANFTLNATDGAVRADDGDTWIARLEIQNNGIIDNQNNAHVKIFH